MKESQPKRSVQFWDYCKDVYEVALALSCQISTLRCQHNFITDTFDKEFEESELLRIAGKLGKDLDESDRYLDCLSSTDLDLAGLCDWLKLAKQRLKSLVVYRELNHGIFGRHEDEWHHGVFEFEKRISDCALTHDEIRESLFSRAMAKNSKAVIAEPSDKPKLNKKQKVALDLIRKDGPLPASTIAEWLSIESGAFKTHYQNAVLKHHGVKNDRDGRGYYVSEESPD